MNNHNNWGSQPHRQAYNGMPNGLPQMPPQPGYQQPYGNGNTMAYMGNQQYPTNGQFLPPPNHQMAPMPHFAQQQQQHQQTPPQAQPQSHHAHNFHAHQQQQQHQPQPPQQHHYSNGAYGHHAPISPAQYMTHQTYSQPHQSFHQPQQVATPSPRQMQQPLPPPRQQAPQVIAQQPPPQALSRPPPLRPTQPPPPSQRDRAHMPSPQIQQRAHTSIEPHQLQQHHSHAHAHVHAPSPILQQQRVPETINPSQFHQSQSHIPSPQLQSRAPGSVNSTQFHQSHAHAASPQPQHRAVESMNPNQLHQARSPHKSHAPSPQQQHRVVESINPNQLHQAQSSHVPSPQTQHRAVESLNPNQLHQARSPHVSHAPSPQPQHRPVESINPKRFQQAQSHVPSPQPQHQIPDSGINPNHLQKTQPQAQPQAQPQTQPQTQPQASSLQTQHRTPDSIDPSQLQQGPSRMAPSYQPPSNSIDPSQLQAQSYVSPTQLHRPAPDAIDPSKLHHGQRHEASAEPDRRVSDAIDPSQLMVQTHVPARKSIPSAASATRSPSISHAHSPSQHFDTPAVLTCVANDCFRAAHSAVQDVATSLDQTSMDEYYKMIATGLGCLEAALALNKLPPRAEANVRLRYATILSEETDNLTLAEVALTKGIAVCEKNRLTDLKYCMQFQLLKVLYRRNRKAALVALDKNISEATTYKAVDWVYAFRFLRASFHLQSGNPADTHAMENLRNIASLATKRGDPAIAVLTSLLEGIIHLKSRKDDSIVRVQHCIAQATKFQLDPSVHIPQIEVLTLLLDLACSLQQKASPQVAMQKLKSLQMRMDELVQASDWDTFRDELLLPLKRQSNSSTSVTGDTKTIIRPGAEHNFIVMTFVTKVHAFVLAYVLSGLALLYHGSKNEKVMEYWSEALNMLAKSNEQVRPRAYSLPMAIEQAKWRAEVGCYIHTLVALISATRTQWGRVHECIQKIDALKPGPDDGRLALLVLYVKGVYFQGTGDLDKAYDTFSNPRFDIAEANDALSGNTGVAPPEVSLLAALNRIWILQEPTRRNDQETTELLERVRPYCADHADIDLRTAFNLVAASIETNPPQSMQTVKRHISTGLKFAQMANNTQLLGVALNLMRSCLFESVVGDQAVKSAKAGRAQAQKAGNLLWMSVGEGMLAQTEEMQGQVAEAQRLRVSGTAHANDAFVKPERP